MEFHNRERELKRLMKIAEFEPHTIYFIFGPINSGKTALIQEFIRRLPKEFIVFYINLREVYISKADDFLKILFEVREKRKDLKSLVRDVVNAVPKEVATPVGKIPIPKRLFKEFFGMKEYENVFLYLREFMDDIAKSKKPIFILDELQVIKDVKVDGKLIYMLFNLFVRLTKELHLCHVFCLTSDSLFVEYIYNEAMLQGRADYMLVDDFDFETTANFLKKFGFSNEEIELVWKYFGGKPVYLIKSVENRDNLAEFCETMLEIRFGQILDSLYELKKRDYDLFKSVLDLFRKVEEYGIKYRELSDAVRWCVDRNILFVNPIKRTIKPQSKLDLLDIKRILGDLNGIPQ